MRRGPIAAGIALMLAGCGGLPGVGPGPTPIPERAITLDGNCSQREEDGFREKARLRVVDNRVEALDWQLWVGGKGGCVFQLAQFRQIRLRPHVELVERDGSACKLMVYQSPQRITLAHVQCEQHCTGDVYDKAWPALFDPRSGQCAEMG